jgi:hypothetical protein
MLNPYTIIKNLMFFICIVGLSISGCSHTKELTREQPDDQAAKVDYSIIYYIHADADYLFHDPNGQPVRANSQVLETALEVAENARSGEVFIFYQRPEKKFLGLFPRNSSMLYHYTNGKKTTQVKYRYPEADEEFLTTEAKLYNRYHFHPNDRDQQNYFLFFGHEIPNDEGKKYHNTLPKVQVNTSSFAEGIQHLLLTDQKKFDLVVLSTCNNGTPAMAYSLAPVANHLLASPQNLHLSHIDTGSLEILENNPEYWEEIKEKDYKILSIRYTGDNKFVPKILEDRPNIEAWIKGNKRDIWTIHSVKRLSDGEVFTVGDKVNNACDSSCFNIKDIVIGDIVYLFGDNSHRCQLLHKAIKNKDPLFVTEDGVDLYEGDRCWFVTSGFYIKASVAGSVRSEKVFSTKEKAEKYVEEHKPRYSKEDIRKKMEECCHINYYGNMYVKAENIKKQLNL